MHAQQMQTHMNTYKAKKDIAAGQEILVRYGNAKWFESRKIPYSDVDYASTMWRPDLQPLPCRHNVIQTIGADGRRSYAVRETVPSGAVLEISLCLEVPLVVVDQFPFLWDFVLTGETENKYNCLPTASPRARTACVLQIKAKLISGNVLSRFCISFLHSLSCNAPNHSKHSRAYDLGG